jgi:DNA-binding transcriptional LysR family regulator
MRSLNLDQLQALTAVAASGSFSAAARSLHLTQPAISLQIKALEERFGVQLIERLGKRAHATPAGSELVAAASRINDACEDAEQRMHRYRDGWMGRVALGTISTVFMYDLPPMLRRLRREHPRIELEITSLPTTEGIERVLNNRLDLAIVTLPVSSRQLRVTPLRDEDMVAIFPPGSTDAPESVTPAYVASQRLLMENERAAGAGLVSRWLERERAQPKIAMRLGALELIKSAVASELGMGIVTEGALRANVEGFVVRPLSPRLPSPIALITHANKVDTFALRIVREALLDLLAEQRKPDAS